jgi:predicted AAA+ superfamily ATPase
VREYGKVLRTFKDQGFKIVISWRSSKLLVEEISTELRGRYTHLLVLPFSFKEILVYREFDITNVEYSIRKDCSRSILFLSKKIHLESQKNLSVR